MQIIAGMCWASVVVAVAVTAIATTTMPTCTTTTTTTTPTRVGIERPHFDQLHSVIGRTKIG
jgi:hypothetical protein